MDKGLNEYFFPKNIQMASKLTRGSVSPVIGGNPNHKHSGISFLTHWRIHFNKRMQEEPVLLRMWRNQDETVKQRHCCGEQFGDAVKKLKRGLWHQTCAPAQKSIPWKERTYSCRLSSDLHMRMGAWVHVRTQINRYMNVLLKCNSV